MSERIEQSIQIFDSGRIDASLAVAHMVNQLDSVGIEASASQEISTEAPLAMVTMRSPYPAAAHVLYALKESGVPLRAEDRSEDDPIMVFGGMAMRNPFFLDQIYDAAWVGDALPQTFEGIRATLESSDMNRTEKLQVLKDHGFYIPSLANKNEKPIFHTNHDYGFSLVVDKQLEVVEFSNDRNTHATAQIEVKRGCGMGCAFCVDAATDSQTMPMMQFRKHIEETLEDNPGIGNLRISFPALTGKEFLAFLQEAKRILADNESSASINIGSTAPHQYSAEVAKELASLGQQTMTFAPEVAAGTHDDVDLRKENKRWLTDKALFRAIRNGVDAGMQKLVLYHLTGFPGETDAHLQAFADMVERITQEYPELTMVRVVSNPVFITPGTPLEHAAQITFGEAQRRRDVIQEALGKIPSVEFRSMLDLAVDTFYDRAHSAEVGFQQAFFQRATTKMNHVFFEGFLTGFP